MRTMDKRGGASTKNRKNRVNTMTQLLSPVRGRK